MLALIHILPRRRSRGDDVGGNTSRARNMGIVQFEFLLPLPRGGSEVDAAVPGALPGELGDMIGVGDKGERGMLGAVVLEGLRPEGGLPHARGLRRLRQLRKRR